MSQRTDAPTGDLAGGAWCERVAPFIRGLPSSACRHVRRMLVLLGIWLREEGCLASRELMTHDGRKEFSDMQR